MSLLLREHAELTWGNFQSLLEYDKGGTYVACTLLSRIPEGLEPLRKRFEAHVEASGFISYLLG